MSNQDIRFDLNRGETQLWAGVPRQGIVLGPLDIFVVPFGIMWTAFAVFWEMSVVRSKGPLFMQAFGAGFILIGCFFTFGRLVAAALRRRRTVYGLTSDRVIIANGSAAPTSLPLATLGEVSVVEAADGTGNIAFGVPAAVTTMFVSMPSMNSVQLPMFEMIPDARQVYDKIREAQQAAARGGSVSEPPLTTPAATPPAAMAPAGRPVVFRFLFNAMFVGVGGFFAYKGAADVYAGLQSTNWPSTSGTVLDARMTVQHGTGNSSGTTYRAHVSYMYAVAGRSFVGDQISFDHVTIGGGSDQAARQLEKYRRGTRVEVRYDPANAGRAVLETGWAWGGLSMAALGFVFALVGLGMFRLMGRAQQTTRPPVSDQLAMRRRQPGLKLGN